MESRVKPNSYIGATVNRLEDHRFLTGRGIYAGDLTREACCRRSQCPARWRMDSSAALIAHLLNPTPVGEKPDFQAEAARTGRV